MSEAAAVYKKQDGVISISPDGKTVSWKSNSGASASLSIGVPDIANLQQTPATAAKASIKIVAQDNNHTFTFTSASARQDQQTITGLLRKGIEAAKSGQNALTPAPDTPDGASGGASAAMTMAQTVSGAAKPKEDTYDDARLLGDIELQRSLLNSSPAMRQRFDRAFQEKPESISIGQFSNQFWASRVHLLRSHAAERSQGAGTYNVLSVVKAKNEHGQRSLNMSKEQIHLIFAQHPLVKKVYNENVPPLSEVEFWSRFFNSRLVKKLKGQRIKDDDPTDPKFDRYMDLDDEAAAPREQQLIMEGIPHFLDVEGNEQNHSQKQGNRPDFTMRPSAHDRAPILRVLNRMSEKMMADVPPSDADRHAPVGLDEDTYKELQLRDLQRAADDNRVVLKVQDQSRFFSAGQAVHTSSSAAAYTQRTPGQVLAAMRNEFDSLALGLAEERGLNLEKLTGIEDDSSSDEEDSSAKKRSRVGSRSSRAAATTQILSAVKKTSLHSGFLELSTVSDTEQAAKLGLSEEVFNDLAMAHNTTIEFLQYFWSLYYSGNPERANEVARLIETLDKSLDRIKAVINGAEATRQAKVDKLQKECEMFTKRTGKKRRFDPNSIKGGGKAVSSLVEPLIRAIDKARSEYQRAFNEQMARAGQLGAQA